MLGYNEVKRFVNQNVLQNMTMLVYELLINGTVEYEYSFLHEEDLDREVYEWWLVSEYFAEKLKEKNEIVLSFGDFNFFWGRTCTGQSISLDYIITEIAEEALARIHPVSSEKIIRL